MPRRCYEAVAISTQINKIYLNLLTNVFIKLSGATTLCELKNLLFKNFKGYKYYDI